MQNREKKKNSRKKVGFHILLAHVDTFQATKWRSFLEQLQRIPWSRKTTVITINLIMYDLKNNVRQQAE